MARGICTRRARLACALGSGVLLAGCATNVAAHGFGQRFDLPVPLWLWLTGAGLTLVLSFAAVIDFLPAALERTDYPRIDLLRWRLLRALTGPVVVSVARVLAVIVFVLTIVAGLAGTPDPNHNLAPTMVWVIFWVGVAFTSALFGDVWAVINPLRTLFGWADGTMRAIANRPLGFRRPYPRWLGVWPAVLLMFGFAWGEHLWSGAAQPFSLGVAILAYSGITLTGMFVYGRETWLARGDIFAIMFSLFARFAILEVRLPLRDGRCGETACTGTAHECVNGPVCLARAARGAWQLNLRPPALGLLNDRRVSFGMIVFVLLVLSGVTFDGFIETPLWNGIVAASAVDATVLTTLALGAFPLLFLIAFVLACALMSRIGGRELRAESHGSNTRVPGLASRFVLTLVPIAVAYHVAHYLTLLTNAGQLVIPLASDPLGRGWDLFGTAAYVPDPGLLSVRTVWYVVVALIVGGHVLSVWLAHVVALDVFATRRAAILSQLPMLVLMVAYTMVSLWILAQPIFS